MIIARLFVESQRRWGGLCSGHRHIATLPYLDRLQTTAAACCCCWTSSSPPSCRFCPSPSSARPIRRVPVCRDTCNATPQLLLPYPGVLRHAHRRIVLAPSLELGGQPIPARTPSSDLTRGRRREKNTLSSARPVIEASHVDNGIAARRTHEDGKQSSRAQQGQLGRRQQRLSG